MIHNTHKTHTQNKKHQTQTLNTNTKHKHKTQTQNTNTKHKHKHKTQTQNTKHKHKTQKTNPLIFQTL